MREVLLYLNSGLLATVTVILSYLVSERIVSKNYINAGLKKLSSKIEEQELKNKIKQYTTKLDTKQGIMERIELSLIKRSNIDKIFKYIPINAYTLIIAIILIFICSIRPLNAYLKFLPTAIVMSALLSMAPVLVLDMIGKMNSQKVRRQLAEFITILNRWCAVKEDIFYAFERSVESLESPLKDYVSEMVIQIKSGIDPIAALDILQIKVNNEQFAEFIVNIKQNIKSRGDTKKLLSKMEIQFYKIENEFTRRKISTLTDRIAIYVIMALVFVTGFLILKFSPEARNYYLFTETGKTLLMVFTILYGIGLYFTTKITKFKY